MREFTEQELVRREKCAKLRELGLDPFGHKFERSATAMEIKDKYKDIDHEAFENMDDEATVAGRIMFIRKMGKASFFTIKEKLLLASIMQFGLSNEYSLPPPIFITILPFFPKYI